MLYHAALIYSALSFAPIISSCDNETLVICSSFDLERFLTDLVVSNVETEIDIYLTNEEKVHESHTFLFFSYRKPGETNHGEAFSHGV